MCVSVCVCLFIFPEAENTMGPFRSPLLNKLGAARLPIPMSQQHRVMVLAITACVRIQGRVWPGVNWRASVLVLRGITGSVFIFFLNENCIYLRDIT